MIIALTILIATIISLFVNIGVKINKNNEKSKIALNELNASACETMYDMSGSILLMKRCTIFTGELMWEYGCRDANDTCTGYTQGS